MCECLVYADGDAYLCVPCAGIVAECPNCGPAVLGTKLPESRSVCQWCRHCQLPSPARDLALCRAVMDAARDRLMEEKATRSSVALMVAMSDDALRSIIAQVDASLAARIDTDIPSDRLHTTTQAQDSLGGEAESGGGELINPPRHAEPPSDSLPVDAWGRFKPPPEEPPSDLPCSSHSWQDEAKRYAGNADYWRERYEAEQQRAAGIMRAIFSHYALVGQRGVDAWDRMLAYIAEADAQRGKGEK